MTAGIGIVIALASVGCYTVKTVTFGSFGGERVGRVWVTRTDQSVVLLKKADVSGDKLRGYAEHEYVELAASDLQSIRVRKLSRARTISLLAAGAASFITVAVIVSGREKYFDPCIGGREGCYDDPGGLGP
jgi:hypothetical protein